MHTGLLSQLSPNFPRADCCITKHEMTGEALGAVAYFAILQTPYYAPNAS